MYNDKNKPICEIEFVTYAAGSDTQAHTFQPAIPFRLKDKEQNITHAYPIPRTGEIIEHGGSSYVVESVSHIMDNTINNHPLWLVRVLCRQMNR